MDAGDVSGHTESTEEIRAELKTATLRPEVIRGVGLDRTPDKEAGCKIYPGLRLCPERSRACEEQKRSSELCMGKTLGLGSYCKVSCTSATCCSVVPIALCAVPTTWRV